MPFLDCLTADLRHLGADWDRRPTAVLARGLVRMFAYPQTAAVVLFRLAHELHRRRVTRPLAHAVKSWSIAWTGAEIHPAAQIGPGFEIAHSVGIVVGHEVRAGRNLVLFHGVTLGHDGRGRSGQPTIGDDVRIFAGAAVLGPVQVGNNARIAANATVLADVPAGTTVGGVWQ
ncbi:MAG TPA: hypothetical protein VFU51_14095 [Gaiellaceae bacterium]|nr:hypothetical protein [Gaiellaceae bacterium]